MWKQVVTLGFFAFKGRIHPVNCAKKQFGKQCHSWRARIICSLQLTPASKLSTNWRFWTIFKWLSYLGNTQFERCSERNIPLAGVCCHDFAAVGRWSQTESIRFVGISSANVFVLLWVIVNQSVSPMVMGFCSAFLTCCPLSGYCLRKAGS